MNNLIRISEKEVVFRVARRHAPAPLDLPLTACIDPIIKIGHDTLEGIKIICHDDPHAVYMWSTVLLHIGLL